MTDQSEKFARPLHNLNQEDVAGVGGKNASLGEMIAELSDRGVRVPGGFATTAEAYREFLSANGLREKIEAAFSGEGGKDVQKIGPKVRRLISGGDWPPAVEEAIRASYRDLDKENSGEVTVAVRSSATAEDLPDASFAGQQETYLNVTGEDEVLEACKKCYASLFTDRAISYRQEKGFDHFQVALSAGVQRMVRADKGASGVLFTLDTDSGFKDVVVINGSWGLGETVVGGEVNPDQYTVYKPLLENDALRPIVGRERGAKEIKAVYAKGKKGSIRRVDTTKAEQRKFVLSDEEVLTLARWAVVIEKHYDKPMDIEWARDGDSGELYILQARPETVHSRKDTGSLTTYQLKETGKVLVEGVAIGAKAATGKVRKLESPEESDKFKDGDILVTEMTDPDWGPIMKRAAGVITDKGGRTAHAAIVSRELGIPAVVGCGDAMKNLRDGSDITLSCTEGDTGRIYEGTLEIEVRKIDLAGVPKTRTEVMINLASPESAFRWASLPVHGVGLARIEFIVNNRIQAHPLALLHPDKVEDKEARSRIKELIQGWQSAEEYFVRQLAEGIARIAASQYPHPAIVRLSDFKTNEYANLLGGRGFEPEEENPMIGFRGAARYHDPRYRDAFRLECRALRRAREEIGFDNIVVMIPFCRTPGEVDQVLAMMAEEGLVRGRLGLEVFLMAEVPSNVFRAREFAARCDGFSIGSNDLTQLVLGISRDSEALADLFDERDEAVLTAIRQLVEAAHECGIKIGLCGQGPSDKPDFAEFLIEVGIDSISLNPDTVMDTLPKLAKWEKKFDH